MQGSGRKAWLAGNKVYWSPVAALQQYAVAEWVSGVVQGLSFLVRLQIARISVGHEQAARTCINCQLAGISIGGWPIMAGMGDILFCVI